MPITFQRSSNITAPLVAYKYYKWHITAIRTIGQDFANLTQVGEFIFLLNGSNQNMSGASVSLLNGHTSPFPYEVVGKLIDGDIYSKFLDLNFYSGGTEVLFEFPSPIIFNGYKWSTGSDAIWRDPKSWTLYGSNDNTNWKTLHIVTDFISTEDRYTFNAPFTYIPNTNDIESKVTFTANYVAPTNDGTTELRAGSSAYQIKRDFPNSTDGLYWISNPNINGGNSFQIYADMTTAGGGWTLIMLNNYSNWSDNTALLRNELTPPPSASNVLRQEQGANGSDNYSIIQWADSIKSSPSGFEYMMDANSRNHYGGIWRANENYSFTGSINLAQYQASGSAYFGRPGFNDIISGSLGFRQNITEIQKFPISTGQFWDYNNDGLESRMPWYSPASIYKPGNAIITTTHDDGGSWWGTLMTDGGWSPAPWQNEVGMGYPGVIWYWVR